VRRTIAIALSLISANASAGVKLERGFFVDHRERCSAGHGYLYYKFDGHRLTYGSPPVSEDLTPVSTSEYIGEHRSDNGSVTRYSITIKNPTEFVWKSKEGVFRMRYCPRSALPKGWRE
jgi:hypothetical protein